MPLVSRSTCTAPRSTAHLDRRLPRRLPANLVCSGTHLSYALAGTGVAGPTELWLWYGAALGQGVRACFEAVLAEPQCLDYFSYTQTDGNCGCNGKAGSAVVRIDANASYYRISGRAYVFGDTNSNSCPANYVRIVDQATCVSAALATGKTWGYNETRADRPMGCFWYTTGAQYQIYLNVHATGAGDAMVRPLCAGAPLRPSSAWHGCPTYLAPPLA